MKLTLMFFAGLREQLGCATEQISVPAQVRTVAELRDWLAARGGDWAVLGSQKNLRAAMNQEMVPFSATLSEGAEVAFFPPVTGG